MLPLFDILIGTSSFPEAQGTKATEPKRPPPETAMGIAVRINEAWPIVVDAVGTCCCW